MDDSNFLDSLEQQMEELENSNDLPVRFKVAIMLRDELIFRGFDSDDAEYIAFMGTKIDVTDNAYDNHYEDLERMVSLVVRGFVVLKQSFVSLNLQAVTLWEFLSSLNDEITISMKY